MQSFHDRFKHKISKMDRYGSLATKEAHCIPKAEPNRRMRLYADSGVISKLPTFNTVVDFAARSESSSISQTFPTQPGSLSPRTPLSVQMKSKNHMIERRNRHNLSLIEKHPVLRSLDFTPTSARRNLPGLDFTDSHPVKASNWSMCGFNKPCKHTRKGQKLNRRSIFNQDRIQQV